MYAGNMSVGVYYFVSILNNGPTICRLAGALILKKFLNSEPLKLSERPSPEMVTEVVIPDEKSADTEIEETLLKGVPPLLFNSSLTLPKSQVSLPSGLGLSC